MDDFLQDQVVDPGRLAGEIKGLRGDVQVYVAQTILLIDAEIVKKGHFWMETNEKDHRHKGFSASFFSCPRLIFFRFRFGLSQS